MNKPVYTYCLLQFRYSQLLEEVLNVGLLIYYPHIQQLGFVYPRSLKRITTVYPDVQEKTIRTYLKNFGARIQTLNKQAEVFAQFTLDKSLIQFISDELLPQDASALQFSAPRKGLLNIPDVAAFQAQLYDLYFSVYETDAINNTRTDDTQLVSRYKRLIKELEHDLTDGISINPERLYYDFEISPVEGEVVKFDIGWKNGTLNLVQPVSFDVTRAESVQRKAHRYYGQSLALEEYADKEKIRFDFLLAKPRNPELFKSYDFAVNLLGKARNVKLVFEEDLESYSKKTIAALIEDSGAQLI